MANNTSDALRRVTKLQKELAATEAKYDPLRLSKKWDGPEWEAVSQEAAAIRQQLFDLTGDSYGKLKVKTIKPSDEDLEANYASPDDVPSHVRQWLWTSSLLFSDATDAVRWGRITDTLNNDRYHAGDLTIYRAVDGDYDDIRPGDWVTTELVYAQDHLRQSLDGKGHILKTTVDGRDVLVSPTGNFEEAIYAPRELSGPAMTQPVEPVVKPKAPTPLPSGVLYLDENDNAIVAAGQDYRISVDKPGNSNYVVLWSKQASDGRTSWRKAGALSARDSTKRIDGVNGMYLGVSSIEIEKSCRGRGLGIKMYRALLDQAAPDVMGVISHTPDRSNRLQVPRIYARLGAITHGDYQVIPVRRELAASLQSVPDAAVQDGYKVSAMGVSGKRVSLSELPEDMQELLSSLFDDSGKVAPESFMVRDIPVSAFPDVKLADGVSDARGQAYAQEMIGNDVPPIIVNGADWIDGRHRVWATRQSGAKYVSAIDLDGAIKTPGTPFIGVLTQPVQLTADLVVQESIADASPQEEFDDWFAGSQVVDATGAPKVVFHGSPIKGIPQSRSSTGAIYCTDVVEVAQGYTHQRGVWLSRSNDATVYSVYLSLRNPLVIDALGKRNDNIPVPWQRWRQKVFGRLPDDAMNIEKILAYAKDHGHDGLIVSNVMDTISRSTKDKSTVYVAISQEQIRSEPVRTIDPIVAKLDIRSSVVEPGNGPQTTVAKWFAGSAVVDDHGAALVVHHGTTATRVKPGTTTPGDAQAQRELQEMALEQGISDWTSVPNIFERWVSMGMANQYGVSQALATHARELYERSRPTVTTHTVEIAFDVFEFPGDGKELGVHFGTHDQAIALGEAFPFVLSIKNPLRLPDLGTWGYQSVMRDARKTGVSISEDEYDAVFNANDNNAALRDLLTLKGYDGVVYKNEAEGHGDSYIAFYPAQIKPTTGLDLSVLMQTPAPAAAMDAAELEERQRRCDQIQKLQNSAGATYTFWKMAKAAIEKASGDPEAVDWSVVEQSTLETSIRTNGQHPKVVHQALCQHSPGAVNAARQKALLWATCAVFEEHSAAAVLPTLSHG